MHRPIFASFLAGSLAVSAGVKAQVCTVMVTSGESHNSIALGLEATLDELISSSTIISPAESAYDLELRIVGAPAHDISHYPEFPHRTKQRSTDDPRFMAFYALVAPDGRLIVARYERCTEYGHECVMTQRFLHRSGR